MTDFGIARIENAGLTLDQLADRHARLHGARAVQRRRDRPARRPLCVRRTAVPAADRAQAVRRRRGIGDVQGDEPRSGAAEPGRGRDAGRRLRRDHRAGPRARPSARFAVAAEFRRALATPARRHAGTGIEHHRHADAAAADSGRRNGRRACVRHAARPGNPARRRRRKRGARPTSAATALAPTGWDADLLAPVERALASVVGPMARLMVKQAARDVGRHRRADRHVAAPDRRPGRPLPLPRPPREQHHAPDTRHHRRPPQRATTSAAAACRSGCAAATR